MANLNPFYYLATSRHWGRGSRIFDDNDIKLKCGWKGEKNMWRHLWITNNKASPNDDVMKKRSVSDVMNR
jgi:hypothetical protein